MTDPRIVYDHSCGRWVACMLDLGSASVRIAVSKSNNPLGLIANWDRYNLDVFESGYTLDFPTLGLDSNGIYVAVFLFQDNFNSGPTSWLNKIVAIKKQAGCPIITQSDIKPAITINQNAGYNRLIVQPAVNFDAVPADGIAWFIGKGDPGTNNYAPIVYGRLHWVNGNPEFFENPWTKSIAITDLPAYYDLDKDFNRAVPQKPDPNGSLSPNVLAGSRLQTAVVRNGFLWTCHHVGLDGPDALYNGGTVDRTACGWFKLKTKADNTLSLSAADGALWDRVFDLASTSPYFYFHPSLMVNSQEDMLIGFSGSKATEHIGAFYSGRRAGGFEPDRPILVHFGRDYHENTRWGDYSYTSLDTDGLTFWTIQEYAEMRANPTGIPENQYGLWITKAKKNP